MKESPRSGCKVHSRSGSVLLEEVSQFVADNLLTLSSMDASGFLTGGHDRKEGRELGRCHPANFSEGYQSAKHPSLEKRGFRFLILKAFKFAFAYTLNSRCDLIGIFSLKSFVSHVVHVA